ncbi:hypothetical protein JQK62_21710, partial [Leptospira santarosai]|nr:hypothetical protein [Leptospira santarosai]
MNKNFWKNTALAGIMTFSVTGTTVYAHDELGGSGEKGENLAGVELSVPLLEGSKNLGNLKEVASVPLKEIQAGVKNSTADVYAYKGYAYL